MAPVSYVRLARCVDIPGILYLMKRCVAQSRYADIAEVDEEEAEPLLFSILMGNSLKPKRKSLVAFVTGEIEHPTGFIAGSIQPLYGGLTLDGATELLWYVDKERANPCDGIALWDALQSWFDEYPKPLVRQQNLTNAVMDPKLLTRIMRGRGFHPIGTVLEKGAPQ